MEIISKELIKPSSSTPDHLKTVKLSLLDQLSPPLYLPLIFFYEADDSNGLNGSTNRAEICRRLKQSLSNTLTLFYPLAGKIDPDNFTIDSNDKGVEFIEARFHTRLSDVIHDPNTDSLHKYLPVDDLLGGIHGGSGGEGTIFMVQVNFFDCGGFAVGACLSHLVGDGSSMVEFMNAWAAASRRGQVAKCNQEFGAMARYLPARDLSDSNISSSLLMGNDKLVTRRLVFGKERIDALKKDARSKSSVEDPTRVEVVSAFICENLMDAAKCRVAHMVNIRSRARPRLESAFGNGCFLAATALMNPRSEMVNELRRAIRRIDDEYVRGTKEEDRYLSDLEELCGEVEEVEGFLFSSWCRFPSYDVDFGWGSPVWVCTIGLPLNNFALLMSTKSGDGIEAWINLDPNKIEPLQAQLNLIGVTN